jgi:hypothetical protein
MGFPEKSILHKMKNELPIYLVNMTIINRNVNTLFNILAVSIWLFKNKYFRWVAVCFRFQETLPAILKVQLRHHLHTEILNIDVYILINIPQSSSD